MKNLSKGSSMTLRPAAPAAALAVALWVAPVHAADLAECTAIADDRQRLACYDKLAGRAAAAPSTPQPKTQGDRRAALAGVLKRCRARMGHMGSSMVKYCVDEDMTAYAALQNYPAEHTAILDRCKRRMGRMGWSMVRYCADEDIAAERALRQMKK